MFLLLFRRVVAVKNGFCLLSLMGHWRIRNSSPAVPLGEVRILRLLAPLFLVNWLPLQLLSPKIIKPTESHGKHLLIDPKSLIFFYPHSVSLTLKTP
jgi:hypothetical protein